VKRMPDFSVTSVKWMGLDGEVWADAIGEQKLAKSVNTKSNAQVLGEVLPKEFIDWPTDLHEL